MEKNLYRITNSILAACICLLCWGSRIGIAAVTWYHCILALVIISGMTAFCYVKLKGRLLMTISVTVCSGVTWFVVGSEKVSEFGASYVAGILGNSSDAMPWGILHESVQVLWIALGAFLFQLLTEKLFSLKLIVSGVLLTVLFVDLFLAKELEHLGVVCMLIYTAIVYVEWTQKHWIKQRANKRKQYIVWLLPFFLIYFLFMYAMPAPEEPYDWKFVKDAYSRLRENFVIFTQNVFNGEREDFATAVGGFSGDGRLLGGLADVNKELIHIQGQKNLKTNVYLVGKVYDTFTGTQWQQNSESTVCDRMLDAFETAYAIELYDEEYERNYMQSTKLNISYKYFNTGYLFTPLKAWSIEGAMPYSSLGSNLMLQEKAGYGTTYEVEFFQLNVNHALFYEFLDAAKEQDEIVWERLQRKYVRDVEERYTLADLEAHREEIYRVYGQKTVLSQNAEAYLEKLTEDARTDVEKLRLIEAALSELTYTKTPGPLPEELASETEFLDYFLFESRKGFCSYFASAFVLLARAEGIPTRYVEGFYAPVEEQGATVYSGMAHAWPEAYIDGVGWIPFEPTPGYESIRYTPWEMEKREKYEAMDFTELPDELGTEGEEAQDELPESILEEEEQAERSIVRIVGYTMLFVIFAGLFMYVLDWYLAKRRYAKWTLEKKLLVELQRNMQLLARLGYHRLESETLEELEQRAWAIMNYEEEGRALKLQFLHLYEDVLYGKHAVQEEMLQKVLEERKYLMEMLKKWKRFAYIYCKISGRY